MRITITDDDGNEIDYNTAVGFMRDDLREELHSELAPCTEQQFFDRYVEEHNKRFDEDFVSDYELIGTINNG